MEDAGRGGPNPVAADVRFLIDAQQVKIDQLFRSQQVKINQLVKANNTLREETTALRECLIEVGAFSEVKFLAQLHRTRFTAARAEHQWSSDACFKHVLKSSDVTLAVASHAGPAAVHQLCGASKECYTAADAIFDSAKAMFHMKMYVCGGNDGVKQLNTMERFDPYSGLWEAMPPMAAAREGHAAAVISGQLYVCGGYDGWQQLSSVERFDPLIKTWEMLPSMSVRRAGPAATAFLGHVVVCGGSDGTHCLNSAERFNPSSGKWEFLPKMMKQRAGPCAAAVLHRRGHTHLYVCGGNDDDHCLSSAERFDPKVKTWEPIPPMLMQREGPASSVIGGLLYVCGGLNGSMQVNSAERFNPFENVWEGLPPMSTRREGPASVVIAGELYVFGGYSGENNLNVLERFEPADRFDLRVGTWKTLTPAVVGRVWPIAAALSQ